MKDFLKYTLATVTGLVITGVLMFIIGILFVIGISASSDVETKVKSDSVFMLDLNGQLVERTNDENIPWNKLLPKNGMFAKVNETIGLNDVLASIKKAKENKDIKGIYLQVNKLGASFASLEEIHDALLDFKKSGKFIVAYSDGYTQGMYYLASVADKVLLNPKGMVDWGGLTAQLAFFKGTLDKLGVEMQIFKVGTYKSAVEPFTNTSMSDANRLQMTELLQSLWNKLVGDVSASRKISPEMLNAYADSRKTTFFPAEECVRSKMVDTLIYKMDVRDYLKKRMGLGKDDNFDVLGLEDMKGVKRNTPKDKSGNVVAVYYASGEITDEASDDVSDNTIVGDKMVAELRDLKEDDDVKAVVIRVNSPGGSAFASEQIWHAVQELKTKKPVVISMGDYAASGGYYISCGANKIFANPTTITGSIGIFGMIPNINKLTQKIGVTFDGVKTNKMSDFGMITRPMNDDEKALLQMEIVNGYNNFVKRCAGGRHMSTDAIEKIAQGRVWDGLTALKLGLVDKLGNLDNAIDEAAKLAKLKGYSLADYPALPSFFESLIYTAPDNYIEAKLMKSRLGEYYQCFNLIRSLESRSFVQARMPYLLSIH